MAKQPSKSSGIKLSNIMSRLRGNFDFKEPTPSKGPKAFGTPDVMSDTVRARILERALDVSDSKKTPPITSSGIVAMTMPILSRMTAERIENRKILQLVPEVDKAAKLMIASCISPTDLSHHPIKIAFDDKSLNEESAARLSEFATNFFQEKLNLKTQLPSWMYQFGYESGACIFAVVPLKSFDKIEDESFVGKEDFITQVVDRESSDSLFGFSDGKHNTVQRNAELMGLESYADECIFSQVHQLDPKLTKPTSNHSKDLINKILATESISLTDNPSVLQLSREGNKKRDKRTNKILSSKYRNVKEHMVVSVDANDDRDAKDGVVGDAILLRLPPESVTIIHTPGDPSDHQGYLVLLDESGAPITGTDSQNQQPGKAVDYNESQGNIFNQVYSAYGLTQGARGYSTEESNTRIYTQIMEKHLRNRLDASGFANTDIGNSDSIYRCMFQRFLHAKRTRVLFLPKDLVGYMTFEMDENGYGVSRLDRIKFSLGLMMSVQISRVLAAIKAAMDRRKVEVNFTENLMESPEAIFQHIVREYTNKSTMTFSIDPNVIQSQMADKSLSIKGTNIPGMETFDITNEPDGRNSAVDFDPELQSGLLKTILNGLNIPASTMNALNEDEYARSISTTNLFFAMSIRLDQDITIRCVSDILRKYARYSSSFRAALRKELPELQDSDKEGVSKTIDDIMDDDDGNSPIERLINSMSISLPEPNVSTSKAQYDSFDQSIGSITNMVQAIFPDDLAGSDDTLGPIIRLLRSRFISSNIRSYLETSGISGMDIPDNNFSEHLTDISTLMNGLMNVSQMLKDKQAIVTPPPVEGDSSTSVDGY